MATAPTLASILAPTPSWGSHSFGVEVVIGAVIGATLVLLVIFALTRSRSR